MVEEDEEADENDIEDFWVPSALTVDAAIFWEASSEACLTEVPSSVV
jgi:hypothetical protein